VGHLNDLAKLPEIFVSKFLAPVTRRSRSRAHLESTGTIYGAAFSTVY